MTQSFGTENQELVAIFLALNIVPKKPIDPTTGNGIARKLLHEEPSMATVKAIFDTYGLPDPKNFRRQLFIQRSIKRSIERFIKGAELKKLLQTVNATPTLMLSFTMQAQSPTIAMRLEAIRHGHISVIAYLMTRLDEVYSAENQADINKYAATLGLDLKKLKALVKQEIIQRNVQPGELRNLLTELFKEQETIQSTDTSMELEAKTNHYTEDVATYVISKLVEAYNNQNETEVARYATALRVNPTKLLEQIKEKKTESQQREENPPPQLPPPPTPKEDIESRVVPLTEQVKPSQAVVSQAPIHMPPHRSPPLSPSHRKDSTSVSSTPKTGDRPLQHSRMAAALLDHGRMGASLDGVKPTPTKEQPPHRQPLPAPSPRMG